MAIPPADLGDHDAKLPVLEAEIEPLLDGQDGDEHMPESSGRQHSESDMHEVESLFEANRHAACRVEQVLIAVSSAKCSAPPSESSQIDSMPRPQAAHNIPGWPVCFPSTVVLGLCS